MPPGVSEHLFSDGIPTCHGAFGDALVPLFARAMITLMIFVCSIFFGQTRSQNLFFFSG
jgi:hypothetical protein